MRSIAYWRKDGTKDLGLKLKWVIYKWQNVGFLMSMGWRGNRSVHRIKGEDVQLIIFLLV
jgi:hypothetical protein